MSEQWNTGRDCWEGAGRKLSKLQVELVILQKKKKEIIQEMKWDEMDAWDRQLDSMTQEGPSSLIPEYEFQNLGTFTNSLTLSSLPQGKHNHQRILKASTGAAEFPP